MTECQFKLQICEIGRRVYAKGFAAANDGNISYRLNDKTVIRAGYGETIIPFPDNSYAFNFPVKQNNQFTAANAFIPPPGITMAAGFPAPVVAQIPSNGRIDAGASTITPFSLGFPVAVSSFAGMPLRNRPSAASTSTPMIESWGPVIPASVM